MLRSARSNILPPGEAVGVKPNGDGSVGGDGLVSVTDVLKVVRDFEPFEPAGVGPGLVAWELHVRDAEVAPVFALARERGLVEPAGWDERSRQPLWRLTTQGRANLAPS